MKITTIWTMPGIPLPERLRRTKEWAAMKTARHLPKSVKYWTCIGVATLAAGPEQFPPSVTIEQMMDSLRDHGVEPKRMEWMSVLVDVLSIREVQEAGYELFYADDGPYIRIPKLKRRIDA